jgi:hypothetical protein
VRLNGFEDGLEPSQGGQAVIHNAFDCRYIVEEAERIKEANL